MTMYAWHAGYYDQATGMFNWLRRKAVEALQLRPGDTVVDVGCGTGLCFPYLEAAIGPAGRLIALDASPAMLEQAVTTAERCGWHNITALEAPAEEADIPCEADGALFCAVHDVLRSPMAVKNVVAHVRPGGRVVATGGKWPPAWMWPLHLAVAATHAPYVTSLEDFDRPWSLLAEHCRTLHVEPVVLGTGFVATGTLPDP